MRWFDAHQSLRRGVRAGLVSGLGADCARPGGGARRLKQAAWEETEHLARTERHTAELGGHKRVQSGVVCRFAGDGVTAGLLGDKWNLGFWKKPSIRWRRI